ncbi:MAG: hypothetical protein O7G85_15575 [Planctomycetota bacterium]|nr:hypothetical protein [Planctomycetota bacterium]
MSGLHTVDMQYFEELRERINALLLELGATYAQQQIRQYTWLYGALGAVPAPVMFICENPSLAGVKSGHVNTPDGGPPDIEGQWWGGPRNNAAKRFRVVLCETGLKTTPPATRGGWRCYITNLVKEANVASDQNDLPWSVRQRQSRDWADLLAWELGHVQPEHVFCVGQKSSTLVRMLQREDRLPNFHATMISHYSKRGADEVIRREMTEAIQAVI